MISGYIRKEAKASRKSPRPQLERGLRGQERCRCGLTPHARCRVRAAREEETAPGNYVVYSARSPLTITRFAAASTATLTGEVRPTDDFEPWISFASDIRGS